MKTMVSLFYDNDAFADAVWQEMIDFAKFINEHRVNVLQSSIEEEIMKKQKHLLLIMNSNHLVDLYKNQYDVLQNESELDRWFVKNYNKLNFSEIRPSLREIGCADYLGKIDNKLCVIELEGELYHVNAHKDCYLQKFDYIICFSGYSSRVENGHIVIIRIIENYPEFLTEIASKSKTFRYAICNIINSPIKRI